MPETMLQQQLSNALSFWPQLLGPFDRQRVHLFKAPGRINLIGEHLDYNGGWVFPAAISLGIYALVAFRDDGVIRLASQGKGEPITIEVHGPLEYRHEHSWANYPKGVLAAFRLNGYALPGADILFFSTLPEGSGLSSSAAIEVLTAIILESWANDFAPISPNRKSQIAQQCQSVENTFIGMQCGIMDQFAIALGQKDHAILLDTNSLEHSYVPFHLKEHSLVILNSNKPRELADSAFNQRRQECRQALDILQRQKGISQLALASEHDLELLADPLHRRRARHVIRENARVHQATQALPRQDLTYFATLLNESHTSLQQDFEVTGFELDALVGAAQDAPGCLGARMTGAGFGGCAIALVDNNSLENFAREVLAQYRERTGLQGGIYPVEIEDGARYMGLAQDYALNKGAHDKATNP